MKRIEAAERAAAYIARHGDDLARLRAEALLGRALPSEVVTGLDPDASDPASLRDALEICDDLRALGDPRVGEWVGAVAGMQAEDGGFAPRLAPAARVFETGMIAGHVAKTRYARPELLEGAGAFLAAHWSPDLVRGGSWSAIAAYAHFFANADPAAALAGRPGEDDADAILQWCGRELARGFRTRAFDAVRTARVLVYCDAHGLPGADLRPQELVVALVSEQDSDGGFAPCGGEGARDAVASTLDAIVALHRLS